MSLAKIHVMSLAKSFSKSLAMILACASLAHFQQGSLGFKKFLECLKTNIFKWLNVKFGFYLSFPTFLKPCQT